MKIDVTINAYDMWAVLHAHLKQRFPGAELGDITVKSWNTEILKIEDGTLTAPVYHHLRREHATFPELKPEP